VTRESIRLSARQNRNINSKIKIGDCTAGASGIGSARRDRRQGMSGVWSARRGKSKGGHDRRQGESVNEEVRGAKNAGCVPRRRRRP
jgi:hypothetical protein